MRIIRYQDKSGVTHYAAEQAGGAYARISGDVFGNFSVTKDAPDIHRMLAPVAPRTIWCIGLNYRQHAIESGMAIPERPVVFMKGANTIQHPGEPIVLPSGAGSTDVDYECELVVVIGKRCKDVVREHALEHVFGYTCGNDVSSRDWQLKLGGSQWIRGKSFDTFAPIGPSLVTADEVGNANALRIRTVLNGETMQDSNTGDMIFDVAHLVSFLSQSTTLDQGDIIFTGTPQGIGMARKPPRWLVSGDEVSIIIDKIGTLTNRVMAQGAGSAASQA